MSKLPRFHRQAWASAGRALLFGLVLAAALSTLAGGGVLHGAPAALSERSAAPSLPSHHAQSADGVVSGVEAGMAADVLARGATPGIAARAVAGAQDPPPYAPGGDDVMQWDEPVRSRDVAASRVPGTAGHVTLATAWTHAAAPPGRGAPSLMLWLDRPRAAVGEPVVLHLVMLGDAQCQGLGLLSGLQPVAGRIVVRAASAGRHQLAVRCVGTGGSVERSVVLVVPLPVLATSQLNRVMTDPAGADSATLPTPGQLSQLGLSVDSVHTHGDFFQEGRHALLLATVAADGATSLHFLARDEQGTWRDRSSELLGDDERLGCRGQAQAITADFNQDGKPDVLLACHVPAASSGLLAAPCCQQIVLLSQPDGRYRRAETAYAVWAAQIEAADIDGNGGIDILAFDANHTPERPQLPRPLLLGRGDGSFAAAGSARPGLPAQGRW